MSDDFNEVDRMFREVTDRWRNAAAPNACFLMLRPELQDVLDAAVALVRAGDISDPELREELTGDLCSALVVLNARASELRGRMNG